MGSAPSRTSLQLLSRSFVPVLLSSPLTARMAAQGLRDACKERPKPKEAGDRVGKVAPFHRVQCLGLGLGGHVIIVQAWTMSEARAIAKKQGWALAKVRAADRAEREAKREAVQSQRAA